MRAVLDAGERAARTAIPILIEGESGAGKEWLARRLHELSPRAERPFVAVNCGAIPSQLVETILFGHEKGAFTGATERHRGKFAEADGGTLLLDEVGELPLDAQVKLLRVLQEGEIEPVGARGARRVDVRIVSATNRRLGDEVSAGRFREDLYYRLGVFPLTVPPLRARPGDIAEIARSLVERFAAEEGTRPRVLDPGAARMLEARGWPGNIRELENAVFRACVLASNEVLTASDFALPPASEGEGGRSPAGASTVIPIAAPPMADPASFRSPVPPSGERDRCPALRAFGRDGEIRTLEALEREMIVLALQHYEGRMSEAARRLGIGRSTLYRKLKEYGLSADEASPLVA